jgi:hypothetical protein
VPPIDHDTPVLARLIDPKRLSDGQHKKMADQVIRASRAAQYTARMRAQGRISLAKGTIGLAKGTIGLAGTAIIGSLGMAAWMWHTGGREILLERAKAMKPKTNPN